MARRGWEKEREKNDKRRRQPKRKVRGTQRKHCNVVILPGADPGCLLASFPIKCVENTICSLISCEIELMKIEKC